MIVSRTCVIALVGISMGLMGCSEAEVPVDPAAPAFSVFADQGTPSDPDTAKRDPDSGGDGIPVVESLTLEPALPVSHGRMRAVATVSGEWTSVDYEWMINGRRHGGSVIEVVLPVITTGDTVSVRVTPVRGALRGEVFSASTTVGNQAPRVLGLDIVYSDGETSSFGADTEVWKAVVEAEDPDGESVDFEYRWFVNGVETDEDAEFFPAGTLVRGDKLEVKVRASDGRASSGVRRSGELEIGNAPPSIVSRPPRVDARGQFRYQVKAEDPDGDANFRFALRQAPRGMKIDDINGIVRWQPDTDQAGRHDIEIVVTDDGGAEATQSFSLALISTTDAEGAVPAAAR